MNSDGDCVKQRLYIIIDVRPNTTVHYRSKDDVKISPNYLKMRYANAYDFRYLTLAIKRQKGFTSEI